MTLDVLLLFSLLSLPLSASFECRDASFSQVGEKERREFVDNRRLWRSHRGNVDRFALVFDQFFQFVPAQRVRLRDVRYHEHTENRPIRARKRRSIPVSFRSESSRGWSELLHVHFTTLNAFW